jgi:hypothetical protein
MVIVVSCFQCKDMNYLMKYNGFHPFFLTFAKSTRSYWVFLKYTYADKKLKKLKDMRRFIIVIIGWICVVGIHATECPRVVETMLKGFFPLASATNAADICVDTNDYRVVTIAAGMLADDVKRVTGKSAKVVRTKRLKDLPAHPAVVAGTLGHRFLPR